MKHIIAYGVAVIIAFAGAFAWIGQFEQTQTVTHDAAVAASQAHKKIVKLSSDADAAKAREALCYTEASLWRDATRQEAQAVSLYLSNIFTNQLDLTDATNSVTQAKAVGCLGN